MGSHTLLNRLTAAWSLAVAGVLFWFFHRQGFDDPFITYRYAENLASGSGFVYNSGEQVLSTTAPLYAMLLAVLQVARADLPLASNALGCLSLALGGWTFWCLGRVWHAPWAAMTGLLLFPTFPHLLSTLGAETIFSITLILLAFLAYASGRYSVVAALLALATITRADAVLAGVVLAADFLLRRRGPIPWRALLIYLAMIAPWFIFAAFYFGAPFPVTLFVKQRQALLPDSQSFFTGFLQVYGPGYWRQPWYWPHFALAGVGLGYALGRDRRWLMLPAWSLLYFAVYSMLGVTRYFWYYAPLVPGFIALAAIGVEALARIAQRFLSHWGTVACVSMLVLLPFFAQGRSLDALRQANDPRLTVYQQAGEWLQRETPQNASVGTLEVGVIGYHAHRRMIDFAGLIQPEVALQLTPSSSYQAAAIWAVDRFRPDYLVLQDGLFLGLEEHLARVARCQSLQTFSHPAYAWPVVIHRCEY